MSEPAQTNTFGELLIFFHRSSAWITEQERERGKEWRIPIAHQHSTYFQNVLFALEAKYPQIHAEELDIDSLGQEAEFNPEAQTVFREMYHWLQKLGYDPQKDKLSFAITLH